MAIRTRTSPGIEIREIDKSQYGQLTDYSIVNTQVFMTGFASKGEDYTTLWVNSLKTFNDYYGQPETEAEKFLYAGIKEVLSKGGVPLVSKLPYANDAKDHFAYVDYKVDMTPVVSGDYVDALSAVDKNLTSYLVIKEFDQSQYIDYGKLSPSSKVKTLIAKIIELADKLEDPEISYSEDDFVNLNDLVDAVNRLSEGYGEGRQDIPTLEKARTLLNELIDLAKFDFNITIDLLELAQLDRYRISRSSMLNNTIRIVDINRNQYGEMPIRYKDPDDTSQAWDIKKVECLGIMPIIVSPVNAMFYQGIIPHNQRIDIGSMNNYEYTENISAYQPVKDFWQFGQVSANGFDEVNYAISLSADNINQQTVSKIAANQFPMISWTDTSNIDETYLKQIGILVFQVYADSANDNKLNFSLLESYVGSLDPNARNSSGRSIYIDNLVNDSSQYINVFSNVNCKSTEYQQTATLLVENQIASSLGFTKAQSEKRINFVESIIKPLNMIFEKNKDPNTTQIDLVLDAGVSNIAQLARNHAGEYGDDYIVDIDWSRDEVNTKYLDNTAWRTVIQKFDNFCRYTRKDCMFVTDGLRSFCLNGNQKLVRRTSIASTVDNTIVPLLTSMAGINSSYTAGYCNWFQGLDDFTGDYMWIPPSIKAVGIYVYCDAYCQKWSAPAGMQRGVVQNVVDCAFNPDADEAGKIYTQCWNYAVNYPLGGIVMEGQKTMQLQKSAFDRVNVRRLFLYLEKQVIALSRYFIYEQNTAYNRQKFIDAIKPVFETAKTNGGIKEYMIKCDDAINTPDVIDNNEMRCIVAIKPIKVLEWIICDFVCTNQSAKVSEIIDQAN